jgi:hypothetical protein
MRVNLHIPFGDDYDGNNEVICVLIILHVRDPFKAWLC